MSTLTREEALEQALARDWYHTIDLAPGKATDGFVDLRPYSSMVLPEDLSGKRVMDIGTFDGFWAFELEKRGAAEVVATDLDDHSDTDWSLPFRAQLRKEMEETNAVPGERFALAKKARDSKVQRVPVSIYDLTPEAVGGPVDVAFIGALLLHLREPVKALEAVRSTLKPGGRIILFEPFVMTLTLLSRSQPLAVMRAAKYKRDWWVMNIAGLKDLLRVGGFEDVERLGKPKRLKVTEYSVWHVGLTATARTDI